MDKATKLQVLLIAPSAISVNAMMDAFANQYGHAYELLRLDKDVRIVSGGELDGINLTWYNCIAVILSYNSDVALTEEQWMSIVGIQGQFWFNGVEYSEFVGA